MKCPKCQSENREGMKFCEQCGEKMELECPNCKAKIPPDKKFCGECGQELGEVTKGEKIVLESEGERKYVTAMISDLSGYTTMSEKLDPEEVKEIMSRIFGEISQVVTKYEGFIEKFIGDAVVAFFGVPKAHEDDPIRAIKVAREIHELVSAMSPAVEKRTGNPILMHTGINTGLVVTGEVNREKGTHGLVGETINVASRLCSLAKADEILVGHDTYQQAEGHFTFEDLEPTALKGKTEPVQVHQVISPKERPVTIHRLSGLKAKLIGRKAELTQLSDAVENLKKGKGRIFSICGDAGTGKSRLIEEFKSSLDLEGIQWIEGHAYAYSQNIPYFPLIDLLNRALWIEEGEPPEKVKEKVESGIERLVGKTENIVPYVGSLYSLHYPEVKEVSPEFWRSRLQEAIQTILSSLAKQAPTIFFLEDLHWADPSFVELLRNALTAVRQPAMVICGYRPSFSLFTSQQISSVGKVYQEIRLQDLSLTDAENMLESLLKTQSLPSDLKQFLQDKAEGNPFYLEELINSLIESETLVRDNGSWKITRAITESHIPPTIHGLISGRLDRLEKKTKRILQEASVIGRTFLYEILKKISELDELIDRGLWTLERLDFIRTRSLQPELEYMFKHPLIQEVVYNGLLKKERQEIHEQIGLVMEQLFQQRLPEFYEILAYHFKQGRSLQRAVDYLMKAGEKSLNRYAVEESHQYYKEAFELLAGRQGKTKVEERLLIEVIIKWALVFYYRGDFGGLTDLLKANEPLANSLDSKATLGMFKAWFGFAKTFISDVSGSYKYLHDALEIGEESGDEQVIGYACCWLAWTCGYLGLYEEAVACGERALEISRVIEADQYLYFKSLGGICFACFHAGYRKRTLEAGKSLVEYGERHSNIRSIVIGYSALGMAEVLSGHYPAAIEFFKEAVQIAQDPFYREFNRLFLGLYYLMNGQLPEAEEALQMTLSFHRQMGIETLVALTRVALALVAVTKGDLSGGLKTIEGAGTAYKEQGLPYYYGMCEVILGRVYSRIAQGEGPKSISFLSRNIGFFLKNNPFYGSSAEKHFLKAIEIAKEIGAKVILGTTYLDLGRLYGSQKKSMQAKECLSQAIDLFQQCDAEVHLKNARQALGSLG